MIINGADLVAAAPFVVMAQQKHEGPGGVSWGLGEAGYDIRIEQEIHFSPPANSIYVCCPSNSVPAHQVGRFVLASAIEEFQMPDNLVGIVHDKSTWARQGLSVFNTVIEPGWKGFLTLELVYHGEGELIIPAGSGIAQVVFHQTSLPANYSGKYQNQPNHPVEAIRSKG
jgi:dCTP deaminase